MKFKPFIALCIIIIFNSFVAKSQQIHLGQNAEEVINIVNFEIEGYNNSQGYNQVTMESEPHYTNGQLDDIIVCKDNVPMLDLNRTANFCTHYIISNNRLSSIIVEYFNLSIELLESKMNKTMTKIGNYYFGNSSNYVVFNLSKSGSVTKSFKNLIYSPLPASILKQFNKLKRINNQPVTPQDLVNRNLPLSKYTSSKTIMINADDESEKKPVSYTIDFYDPKLPKNDTLDINGRNSVGKILIKNAGTTKILKNLIIGYSKKTINDQGIIYTYHIMNTISIHDENVLNVTKWNKPLIVDGKSYNYSFELINLLADGSNEGSTILLSNSMK